MKVRSSKRKTVKRTLGRSLLVALAAASFGLPAIAGQPAGVAHVKMVDVSGGTIGLLGDVYRVNGSTQMVDARGMTVEISDLRPAPADGSLFSGDDVDAVAWRAVETPTGWVITELKVLEKLPD